MTLRVAAAQIECRPGDIEANLTLHLAAVRSARERGIDLLVFPELSLTDYLSEPDTRSLSRASDAPELCEIALAAGDMAVSVGFIERDAAGRIYNAQALLSGGACLKLHRKANLPTYGKLVEGRYYAPGRRIEPTSLPGGWTVATLTCADTWNPALPWLAAIQEPDLLVVPVASSVDAVEGEFDNPGGWDLNLRHTAMTYGLPVVMANHCGRRGALSFWGGSRILDPFGRELARAGAEPGLVWADLDREDIVMARRRLPTIRDAAPDLVQEVLGRVLSKKDAR
jgi:predicted amidohydrolase